MPVISIIVPIFNGGEYLPPCLDSIMAQTFTDIEIILINDGSTDNSGALCDSYALKDSRIKVLHCQNGGVSAARNAGLDIARGQYFGFVDCDDLIAPDMYEVLLRNACVYDADISAIGMAHRIKGEQYSTYSREFETCLDNSEALRQSLIGDIVRISLCDKLYKRYIFDDLRLPLGMYYEDTFILVETMRRAKTVYISTRLKYFYRQREGSITKNEFSVSHTHEIMAHEYNLQLVKQYFPRLRQYGQARVWWSLRKVMDVLALQAQTSPQYKEYTAKYSARLRKDYGSIIKNRTIKGKTKITYFLIAFLKPFYMRIARHRILKMQSKWY